MKNRMVTSSFSRLLVYISNVIAFYDQVTCKMGPPLCLLIMLSFSRLIHSARRQRLVNKSSLDTRSEASLVACWHIYSIKGLIAPFRSYRQLPVPERRETVVWYRVVYDRRFYSR